MTRIAIVADTHGNMDSIRESLSAAGNIAGVLHPGEGVLDGKKAVQESGLEFWGVCGNEDYGVDVPEDLLIKTDGWSILMTHGHPWAFRYHEIL